MSNNHFAVSLPLNSRRTLERAQVLGNHATYSGTVVKALHTYVDLLAKRERDKNKSKGKNKKRTRYL